jgi:hypothetical protein
MQTIIYERDKQTYKFMNQNAESFKSETATIFI